MTRIRQFFKKTTRAAQNMLAAIAAVGMISAVTPTVAYADGPQHNSSNFSGIPRGHSNTGFKGNHGGFRGHNRGFRGQNRGFRGNNSGFRGHNRGFSGQKRGFSGHNRGFRGHNRGNGNAIAAGIIGLTAGAIIASEVNRNRNHSKRYSNSNVSYQPYTAEWYAACARKYRSFNAKTGRYLAHSGKYHLCKI